MPIDAPQIPRFQALRRLSFVVRTVREMQGQFPRECNICGFEGGFLPGGRPPRYDAKCPRCQSVERHRLVVLALEEQGLDWSGGSVLHFAPEPAMEAFFRAHAGTYISADITPGRADRQLDIENIDMPEHSLDVVVASHVLEHVDDRAALRSLHRVLKPGGLLVALVPIVEAWPTTYENAAVVDPKERLLHFGQEDHVRYYGRDFVDRLREGGFEVTERAGTAPECVRLGLMRGEKVFLGRAS
ncbi:MAG: methyltransferase domain-containing protein [Austwickia sp.]|nr:methyltransferase domain-containing protein [Austwickia sp.]MCO5310124.1 methyltransferase domain-containing protein [Austwickia sp.]